MASDSLIFEDNIRIVDNEIWNLERTENASYEAIILENNATVNVPETAVLQLNYLVVASGTGIINGGFSFSPYNIASVIVAENSTLKLSQSGFNTITEADVIKINGSLEVDGGADWAVLSDFIGNNVVNNIYFSDAIYNVNKVNVAANGRLHIGAAKVDGTNGNDTISIGASADVTITGNVDLQGGKNQLTIGNNAQVQINGKLSNTAVIKIAGGKNYKNQQKHTIQGWTLVNIDGDVSASVANNSLTIGSFSNYNMNGSYGRDYSAGYNTVKIDAVAVAYIGGSMYNVRNLTMGNGKQYTSGNNRKIQGWTELSIEDAYTGTIGNDSVKIGSYAKFSSGSMNLRDGKNTISVGTNSSFTVGDDLIGLSALTVSNGAKYKQVDGTYAYGRTTVSVAGDVEGNSGTNSIKIGKSADFSISGNCNLSQAGKSNSLSLGQSSIMSVGGNLMYVNKLTLSTGGKSSGDTILQIGGDLQTTGKSAIKVGSYGVLVLKGDWNCSVEAAGFSAGDYTEITFAGDIDNLSSFKVGKNSVVNGSTSAIAAIMASKFSFGKNTVVYDIGMSDVAVNFAGITQENSDDTLASTRIVESGSVGWLCNKNSYDSIKSYSDYTDIFQLSNVDATNIDLSDWEITGTSGSLDVSIWSSDGVNWTRQTVIDQDGRWLLGDVDLSNAVSYRIEVGISNSAGHNAYGYNVNYIA